MRDFHIGSWTISLYRRDMFKPLMARSAQPIPMPDAEAEGEMDSRGPERWADHPVLVARAERLLQEHLSEEQRAELAETGGFTVVGSLGHYYRITRERSRNVTQLDHDGHSRRVVRWLCAGPTGVPQADLMLAQKCLLEADELEFAFLANVYTPRRIEGHQATARRQYGEQVADLIGEAPG